MNTYRPLPELGSASGALAVELDPLDPGFRGTPPGPLDRPAATALAQALARDLSGILGGIEHLGLVVVGALYDQTELLRPGFPLTGALEDIFKGTLRDADYTPQLIALGTDSGRFPAAAIDPARTPGSGPLLLLPFTFVGRRAAIAALSGTLENLLLQNGRVSEQTAVQVREHFGVAPRNLSYATLADLCALLKVQLDNSGFAPLWELLAHALFRREGSHQVALEAGNRFVVAGDRVHTPFYTFDEYAGSGPGRELDGPDLEQAYSDWTQAQRQYTLTLEAHGLSTRAVLGAPLQDQPDAGLEALDRGSPLEGDYLVETVERSPGEAAERRLEITHQCLPALGTLAYTVLALGDGDRPLRLEHYYPLTPRGLGTIVRELKRRSGDFAAQRQVLHPGRLLWSVRQRRLRPATPQDIPAPAARH